MLTAYNGHTETARVLLDHGAPVNDRDGSGRTALMYAASGPNDEAVRLLLEWKADPLAVDQEERFTALMFAAAEGHADVVRTLLRHGSDPDIVDVDGDRALDFAARNGHEEVVRLLSDEQGRKQE
jgi:ankyrin repeat protein